jgi:hypothetical protein
MNLLDRLFRKEEINGGGRCPTYLYRWTLLSIFGRSVYLHHFVGDDWSRDLHDHPKRFISIGLWGGYTEETPAGIRDYRAPWVRTFPAEHIHRIALGPHKTCWTLVIVLKAVRDWGFWHDGKWMHWKDYVRGKFSALADSMRACD